MIITDIISSIASVVTSVIALLALCTWKQEFNGKKKIELAAKIMYYVYEIQDLFINIRLPIIIRAELNEALEWIKNENKKYPDNSSVYPERVKYLVPHLRLSKQQKIIDNFRALQNQAYMYWGKEIITAFIKLTSYNLKIMQASKDLYYGKDTIEYKQLYKTIFYEIEDNQINPYDEVNMEIDAIVEEFRYNLEQLYKNKRTKWFNKSN